MFLGILAGPSDVSHKNSHEPQTQTMTTVVSVLMRSLAKMNRPGIKARAHLHKFIHGSCW